MLHSISQLLATTSASRSINPPFPVLRHVKPAGSLSQFPSPFELRAMNTSVLRAWNDTKDATRTAEAWYFFNGNRYDIVTWSLGCNIGLDIFDFNLSVFLNLGR